MASRLGIRGTGKIGSTAFTLLATPTTTSLPEKVWVFIIVAQMHPSKLGQIHYILRAKHKCIQVCQYLQSSGTIAEKSDNFRFFQFPDWPMPKKANRCVLVKSNIFSGYFASRGQIVLNVDTKEKERPC